MSKVFGFVGAKMSSKERTLYSALILFLYTTNFLISHFYQPTNFHKGKNLTGKDNDVDSKTIQTTSN